MLRSTHRRTQSTLFALVFAALTIFASRAGATWSIVVVNKDTGEVGVASATCLQGFDLRLWLPVMLVGVGGAAAQAQIDDGTARRIIWDELQAGTEPKDILDVLEPQVNNWGSRQYGIVSLEGKRASFTGGQTLEWSSGVAGRDGDIVYAIQGNILTGEPVIDACLDAVLHTRGDLAEKMMAGMEAARAMGGDGRCSCDQGPQDCGSPPDNFDKSAHVGFMLLSRLGDTDGTCDSSVGCANGDYYMNLNVIAGINKPDPVITLRTMFDQWREDWRGRPDHVLTTVEWASGDNEVPGNGTSMKELKLALIDWEGTPINTGGAKITVVHAEDSAGLSYIDTPIDHGDGTYTVPITAGTGEGKDIFEIWIDDGISAIRFAKTRKLNVNPTLVADVVDLSASGGSGVVSFDLHGPESVSGRCYLVLAAFDSVPGMTVNGIDIPLNPDEMFLTSYIVRNGPHFVNTEGILGADGSGKAQLVFNPPGLLPFVGETFEFALITTDPLDFASNGVTLTIVP